MALRDAYPPRGDWAALIARLDAAGIEWSLFVWDTSARRDVTVYLDDPEWTDDEGDSICHRFDLDTGALLP